VVSGVNAFSTSAGDEARACLPYPHKGRAMSNLLRLRPNIGLPLSNDTLRRHRDRVQIPTYDRSALTPSIVHVGVGGFHRAHQAVYLDDIAGRRISSEWGITGVGLRRPDTRDALAGQDWLYTLVERSAGGEKARVIGAMTRYLYAREQCQQVLAALADGRTRVVSLTITGDGYYLEPGTLQFDSEAPDVRADLHEIDGPYRTAWGLLAEALHQRRHRGQQPFTVMSCDNLADNGKSTRAALVSFAALRDPRLAQWIDANVAFPSTMVDRITPKTAPEDRATVERTFGVADRWPVITETFSQWVVQDEFCNGRPPLEEVGVEMVGDVTAHKLVKSRLLNGTHCALGYLGLLAGYERTHEAMGNPAIHAYVEQLMREEIAPLLPTVPGLDVDQYCGTLLRRLANPRISDQLSRLAARGSTKMPSYLLPSLFEARTQGRPSVLLQLAVAAWLRYLRGYDFKGRTFAVEDPRAERLVTLAKVAHDDAGPLLRMRDVFADLGADPVTVNAISGLLRDLDHRGVLGTVRRNLASLETRTLTG
jgi:mannitol 2-dehydrogenase